MNEIWDAIEELSYQIADLKRRQSNFIRPAVVHQVVDGNTVVADFGTSDAPALTHNLPVAHLGGSGKDVRPMIVGQQITLLCPDGDIANAFVLPGGYHDQNPPPATATSADIVAQRGSARAIVTDATARIEFGSAYVEAASGKITLSASTIVLSGDAIYLGSADASKPVAMLGTLDTGDNADVSNLSTKVYTE